MKIALCTSDFYAPVHHSIKQAGHEVSHVFTSCDLNTGWSLQTAEFAREMRAKFAVGRVTETDIQEIQRDGVDLLISAAYDYKIPVPADGSLKSINVHGTLLPEGRGPWPTPHLLLRHPEAAGMTLHTMTDRWDFGDIVLQEKIEVTAGDDSDSLIAKMVYLSGKLSRELLSNFDKLWAKRRPMVRTGSYWTKPSNDERTITPHDDPARIAGVFRAFGKMTLFSDGVDQPVGVNKVVLWEAETEAEPGTLVASNNDQKIYAIRNGLLSVYLQKGT